MPVGTSAQRTPAQVERDRAASRRINAAKYAEFRDWINAIKLTAGCADCGYREHPAALDFDHQDPWKKRWRISGQHARNRADVEAEIAKCEVVCSNCHRVRTANGHRKAAGRPRSPLAHPGLFAPEDVAP